MLGSSVRTYQVDCWQQSIHKPVHMKWTGLPLEEAYRLWCRLMWAGDYLSVPTIKRHLEPRRSWWLHCDGAEAFLMQEDPMKRLIEEAEAMQERLRQQGFCTCEEVEHGFVVDESRVMRCGDCGGRLRGMEHEQSSRG